MTTMMTSSSMISMMIISTNSTGSRQDQQRHIKRMAVSGRSGQGCQSPQCAGLHLRPGEGPVTGSDRQRASPRYTQLTPGLTVLVAYIKS
jgi:hypothetical protein